MAVLGLLSRGVGGAAIKGACECCSPRTSWQCLFRNHSWKSLPKATRKCPFGGPVNTTSPSLPFLGSHSLPIGEHP